VRLTGNRAFTKINLTEEKQSGWMDGHTQYAVKRYTAKGGGGHVD
jgi:hypothetical protein